ncbi:MAG: hypothetical protein HYS27_03170 [Deltaproteobacteria bacterium]|nr:hypothetical protein [Deltaproteobacteria bacterium]
MDRRTTKHVWMVEDAPACPGDRPRSLWTKIGLAVENPDGSLSLHLSAVPVSGRMVIFDAKPPVLAPTEAA